LREAMFLSFSPVRLKETDDPYAIV